MTEKLRAQNTISVVIHTQINQFHRGRQCRSGSVVRTDVPVYMRERGGGRRGSSIPRNAISAVIDTDIHHFAEVGSVKIP